jgi:hypothetical protein
LGGTSTRLAIPSSLLQNLKALHFQPELLEFFPHPIRVFQRGIVAILKLFYLQALLRRRRLRLRAAPKELQ